jgi:hypothetical protein
MAVFNLQGFRWCGKLRGGSASPMQMLKEWRRSRRRLTVFAVFRYFQREMSAEELQKTNG